MTAGRRFPQVSPMPAEPTVMSPPHSCSCSNLRQSPSAITERKTLAVQTKTSFNHFFISRILLASGYGDSPFTLLLTFYRQARSCRIGFLLRGRACVTRIHCHSTFSGTITPSLTRRVAALRYARKTLKADFTAFILVGSKGSRFFKSGLQGISMACFSRGSKH
jgi:hypothetical protein